MGGRVYFGTTAGKLHLLDAETGKVVKSVGLGHPILGSVTHANASLYMQTLDGIVHCLDLEAEPR